MESLVKALKDKCYSKEELINILRKDFPNKTQDALRKRCERYIKKLCKLGLVEKRDDKFCWYFYVNLFKEREEYSSKLEHSRMLIPALRQIVGIAPPFGREEYISVEDMKIRIESVEDHLKAYPALWKLLSDWRGLRRQIEEMEDNFKGNLMARLKAEFGKVVEYNSRLESFVTTKIPDQIYACIYSGYDTSKLEGLFKVEGEELSLMGVVIAKDSRLHGRVRTFIRREVKDEANINVVKQIQTLEDEARDKRSKLEKEIRKLILRIEAGEPLLGGCDTCPKVYFTV